MLACSCRGSKTLVALLTPLVLGCGEDLSKFQLEQGQAYCGRMVSAPSFHTGFIPEGAPPLLRLRLELDVDLLTTLPGRLSSDDRDTGLCRDRSEPLFDQALLRAIPPVQHDLISELQFGEGREHSFFSYVDSSCQGTMLGVISLMHSGDVEVRLFKPAPQIPSNDAAPQAGYALFYLKARDIDGCGF